LLLLLALPTLVVPTGAVDTALVVQVMCAIATKASSAEIAAIATARLDRRGL